MGSTVDFVEIGTTRQIGGDGDTPLKDADTFGRLWGGAGGIEGGGAVGIVEGSAVGIGGGGAVGIGGGGAVGIVGGGAVGFVGGGAVGIEGGGAVGFVGDGIVGVVDDGAVGVGPGCTFTGTLGAFGSVVDGEVGYIPYPKCTPFVMSAEGAVGVLDSVVGVDTFGGGGAGGGPPGGSGALLFTRGGTTGGAGGLVVVTVGSEEIPVTGVGNSVLSFDNALVGGIFCTGISDAVVLGGVDILFLIST